jgi:SAM-dependent methyltransferase
LGHFFWPFWNSVAASSATGFIRAFVAETYFYSGKEELEAARLMPNYNGHIARLFFAATGRAKVVLDFGAGIGNVTREYFRLSGVRPLVIELDPQHRTILAQDGYVCIGTLEEIENEQLDAVISSNVLEHIQDDEGVLQALRPKLAGNGIVVMWVPALSILWTALDDRVGHMRRYSKGGLISVFERAGFLVHRVRYHDSLGFFLTLLYRVIGSREGRLTTGSLRFFDTWIFPVSRVLDLVCGRWFGKNLFIVASPK